MKRLLLFAVLAMLLTAGAAHADLIAHWTFDEDVTDEVSATAGTLEGNATINTTDALSAGCLEIPDEGWAQTGVDLDLTTAISISAWIATDTPEFWGVVVTENHYDEPGGRLFGVETWEEGDLPLSSLMSDVGWVDAHWVDDVSFADGDWHHVAWTLADDGTSTLYADGVAVGDTFAYGSGGEMPTNVAADIWGGGGGFSEPGGGEFFQFIGLIDDVQIYAEALDAQGILDIFEAGFAPPPPTYGVAIVSSEGSGVTVGSDVTFGIELTDIETADAVQWSYEGEDLQGETGESLVLLDVQLEDSGTYGVTVTFTPVGGGDAAYDEVSDDILLWVLSAEAPLAGGLGLGLLAGACALAGVVAIRRKK